MKYDPSFPALCDHYWSPPTPGYVVGYITASASAEEIRYFEEYHADALRGTRKGYDKTHHAIVYGWPEEEGSKRWRRDCFCAL